MASVITYVDVANTKSAYDGDDIIVIQDKIESTESADAKYAAMKKTKLSPMRLFMQSGMVVELSFTNSILTFTLKNASGSVIDTKTVEILSGVSDVTVDGTSVVEDGVAKVDGKYTKPVTGIPKNDLAVSVQNSLDKADSAIQSHQDISGKADKTVVEAHINNGEIHVQASDKTAWNAKYSKPTNGIPKTDLSSEVQGSLAKADTALQEHQDISGKQDLLISGNNIKTINHQNILGSGNINISGSGGIIPKGEKTGAELAALTVDDVEPGWTYRCTSAYGSFEANVLYSAIVDGTSLSWMKVAIIDLENYVQKTRKINEHTLENDVTLNLTDLPDYEVLTQAEALAILNA